MPRRLDELLQRCTVKLAVPGKTGWGSGFCVAPGLILTCAHVVEGMEPGDKVQVSSQGQMSFADATLTLVLSDFDLALLQISPPPSPEDLPCVYLDPDFEPFSRFYTFGYADQFPDGASVTSECEGLAFEQGKSFILFKSGQIRPGISGSALLNWKTGKVCGIVKFTRDRNTDLGGGAIPTQVILEKLPQLQELQKEFHQQDTRWTNLLSAINWREVCHMMLLQQQQLTSNLLRGSGDFELKELYVPLGLVEKQPPKKREEDISPELGSLLDRDNSQGKPQREEEKEKIIPITHDQFFGEVLKQGVSPKSKGRRIALTGEAGSGKTTLLQKIAFWILDNDLGLPIWVPLGQVESTLSKYLIEDWLFEATANITPEIKQDLEKQCDEGRVWLLLDGLDERRNPREAGFIRSLQSGWVTKARMVLSSRLNTWEIAQNTLREFDIYRNLDFEPEQVKQFVHNWFAKPENAASGERLLQALSESGKERIRDLVRNPLCCSLLCRSWQLGGEQLPDTKAQLFTQFVEVIYQWKDWTQETFTTPSRANKQELDQALGRLAQRAIDEEKSRFVLRQDFVTSELGDPEDPLSLFYLAKKLGWLNMVQEDLKNSQNNTWAFLHPTFQEYFAASALDDWDFFLPRNHKNSPVANKPYRIFEPQWKEVILLWLGRESIDEEQKKDFIRALVEFDDGCGKWPKKTLIDKGFYEYRAYFLAAAGIAEFGDFPRADEIVRQIVQWSFGYLDKKGERQRFPIEALAQEALQKTEPTKAIAILVQLIKSTRDEELLIQASESLGKIDCGNEIAIATLVQLVKSTEVHSLLSQAIKAIRSLGEIGRHNEMAIAALVQLAQSSRDEYILDEVIESLEKIDPGNETAIATALVSMISGASGSTLINAAESLGKIIRSGNEFAMAMLVKLLEPPSENEWRLRQAHEHALRSVVYALGKIGIGHEIAIAGLVRVIESEEYEYVRNYEFLRRRAVDSLGEIGTGNETAIVALVNLIKSTEDGDTRGRAIYILGEIGRGSETAITALVELLESPKDEGTRFQATESLRKIVTSNEIAITALVELLESAKDDNTGWLAVDLLETIGVGNEMAITALAKLLELELDVYTRRRVSYILKKISSGDEPSNSEGLVEVFESTENEETTIQASESLREIDSSNEFLIGSLVKKLESIEDEENIIKVAESLGKVDPGNETAISALVKVMRSDEYLSDQAIESLGEIGKGNEMAVAILVKVLKSTEDKETIIQAAKSLGKIDPGNETAISGLLKVIRSDEDEYLYDKAFACLEDIWLPKNFMEVVAALKDDLSLFLRFVPLLSSDRTLALYKALRLYRFDVVYSTKLYPVLDKGSQCYHAIWQCAQTLSYPEFYEAWHRSWLKSLPRLFR